MIPTLIDSPDPVSLVLETLVDKLNSTRAAVPHHVVLTGGTHGMEITRGLAQVAAAVPSEIWAHTHLWWGDERFVESTSRDRNDFEIKDVLGNYFIEANVHRVPAADLVSTVYRSADIYSQEMRNFETDGMPLKFTVVILGVGPDGHVASLFPGRPELNSTEIALPVFNSPKPPPTRVTLSFTTLNNSHCTLLLAGGAIKKDALESIMSSQGTVNATPARGISAAELYALA